ncbi:hypothetical protein [Ornithinimicrobium cerasi]|uniref:Repeat domain-containing protein n=1 Tax=Ornithinimicrobium cerasi TaxID=2248773 RepID=A0A285VIU4_9MICO|nr:hypothetical protein [Ornithinimicrobium cerasi]SOC53787.1 hypothetical protein SAMN05421879_102145 [Ornithinimicrobium cerasi]
MSLPLSVRAVLTSARTVLRHVAAVQLPLHVAAVSLLRFGGEDPLLEADDLENWHHRRLSFEAARASGWAEDAAMEMSWHTDYVDSYLYNPLWWFQGGLDRVKTALSLAPTLTKIHFDDLTDVRQIEVMWHRYRGGLLAGVLWAADLPLPLPARVAAARHVVGVALHPVQDFYSHSSWVDDPSRRGLLWTDPHELARDHPIYTGNYELSPVTGIAHHGRFAPECTVLRMDPGLLEVLCHPVSPLTKNAVCDMYRACQDGVALGSTTVYGVPVPAGLVYLAPPGIALDSRWVAPIGAQQRGFPQADAEMLFTTALRLAGRQSAEILCGLTRALVAPELATFWQHVRSDPAGDEETWQAEFEDFDRQGVRFLGTGEYPPKPAPVAEEWYVRLRLVTADESGAGTDADIYASVDSGPGEHLLDNMPDAGPLLAYDDFEKGDDQVFHIGPFDSFPSELVLRNADADLGDVLEALGRTFVNAVRDAVYAIGDLLLSLIGGHADHVATEHRVWTPAQLAGLTGSGSPFSVDLNGGGEGHYRVHGTIRRSRRHQLGHVQVSDWEVRLDALEAVEESDWDRGSDSDEPFLIAMLVNQASRTADHHLFGPWSDVDTGERRGLGRTVRATGVPDRHGHLTLALQLWESDDEGGPGRRNAYQEFIKEFQERTAPARDGFLDTLGRSLGSAWTVERLEAHTYGFSPDGTVRYGRSLDVRPGTIEGGETRRWRLGVNHESVSWTGRACPRDELRRLDTDGDGAGEILVSSPWGVGLLGDDGNAGLTSRSMAPNGTAFGAWTVDTSADRFGPSGRFDPTVPVDQVWVRGPAGLSVVTGDGPGFAELAHLPEGAERVELVPGRELRAGPGGWLVEAQRDDAVFLTDDALSVLGADGGRVLLRARAVAGEDLGGWTLDPRADRVVAAGDLDGDGLDELVLHGAQGLAMVKVVDGVLRVVARLHPGQDLGLGDPLDPELVRVGPAADLRASGRLGVLVTTPAVHGFLELEDGRWRSTAYANHDTRAGDWVVDVRADRFGPVGPLRRSDHDLWLSSPTTIGVLVADGYHLTAECCHPVGEMFDDWTPTPDTRYGVGRAVQGREGLVLAVNDWGVVLIEARDDRPHVVARVAQARWAGGWVVDTRVNAFQ